jgi:hypothetical protein
MNQQEFFDSLKLNQCPDQLNPYLQALWYDAAGDWNTAHEIVQHIDGTTAARIHAYLHRKEGDEWNSRYWHRRAGTSHPENMSLAQEWEYLVDMLVE